MIRAALAIAALLWLADAALEATVAAARAPATLTAQTGGSQ